MCVRKYLVPQTSHLGWGVSRRRVSGHVKVIVAEIQHTPAVMGYAASWSVVMLKSTHPSTGHGAKMAATWSRSLQRERDRTAGQNDTALRNTSVILNSPSGSPLCPRVTTPDARSSVFSSHACVQKVELIYDKHCPTGAEWRQALSLSLSLSSFSLPKSPPHYVIILHPGRCFAPFWDPSCEESSVVTQINAPSKVRHTQGSFFSGPFEDKNHSILRLSLEF